MWSKVLLVSAASNKHYLVFEFYNTEIENAGTGKILVFAYTAKKLIRF
jgi:hypothetical protein